MVAQSPPRARSRPIADPESPLGDRPEDETRSGGSPAPPVEGWEERASPSPLLPLGALVLFALVVVAGLSRADSWSQARELLVTVLPVFTGALGIAGGYFVARRVRT